MPTNLADYVGGMPQNLPGPGPSPEPVRVFSPTVAYADNATVTAAVKPYRNGALPDPRLGGFSENVDPTNGYTIDQSFSPHQRADLLGQGHYDLVPVPVQQIDGPGTPNRRFTALRAGALQQLTGAQRDPSVTALQFATALSGYQAGLTAGR